MRPCSTRPGTWSSRSPRYPPTIWCWRRPWCAGCCGCWSGGSRIEIGGSKPRNWPKKKRRSSWPSGSRSLLFQRLIQTIQPSTSQSSMKRYHIHSMKISCLEINLFFQPTKHITVEGHNCLNLATHNYLGFAGNEEVEKSAIACIRKFGVGSCGPRAFYGTAGIQLKLASIVRHLLTWIYS